MSENNTSDDFAAASGKSPAEIAFELVNKLKGQGVWGERNMPDILDMYAECLDAANGLRAYEGQNRVVAPVHRKDKKAAQPQATPQFAPQMAPHQVAPNQVAPNQVAPLQAAPNQGVHAQQAAIQQTFRQG